MKTKGHKGRGDRKAQQKRRRERMKRLPQACPERVRLIDGNLSFYPVGWCRRYKGYLTQGLMDVHGCIHLKCPRFEEVTADE